MSNPMVNVDQTYDGNEPPPHTLGQRAQDDKGFDWVFVRMTEGVQTHRIVAIDGNHAAAPCTASNSPGRRAAVATHAIGSGDFGWVCVWGSGSIRTGSASAGHALYTDTTAGRLNDTASSQTRCHGIYLLSNASSQGNHSGMWAYPIFGG